MIWPATFARSAGPPGAGGGRTYNIYIDGGAPVVRLGGLAPARPIIIHIILRYISYYKQMKLICDNNIIITIMKSKKNNFARSNHLGSESTPVYTQGGTWHLVSRPVTAMLTSRLLGSYTCMAGGGASTKLLSSEREAELACNCCFC